MAKAHPGPATALVAIVGLIIVTIIGTVGVFFAAAKIASGCVQAAERGGVVAAERGATILAGGLTGAAVAGGGLIKDSATALGQSLVQTKPGIGIGAILLCIVFGAVVRGFFCDRVAPHFQRESYLGPGARLEGTSRGMNFPRGALTLLCALFLRLYYYLSF